MTPPATIDEWILAFSKTMALEFVRLIDEQSKAYGPNVGKAVAVNFIAAFTAATVVRSLGSEKIGTESAQYKATTDSFLAHKVLIQEAIAAAFTGPMSEFSGKPVEYYCTIKTVPQMPSKSIN